MSRYKVTYRRHLVKCWCHATNQLLLARNHAPSDVTVRKQEEKKMVLESMLRSIT